VTVDQLLGMSAQQLSDPSLQELRQKQYSQAVEDVSRVSMEQELENKRRSAMANQSESWRSGSSLDLAVSVTDDVDKSKSRPQIPPKEIARAASTDSNISEIDMLDQNLKEATSGNNNADLSASVDVEENMTSMDGTTQRSLAIEQRVLASQSKSGSAVTNNSSAAPIRAPKRPLDPDAMTRLTTTSAKPVKIPKLNELGEEIPVIGGPELTNPISPKASLESPSNSNSITKEKQHKAPTLLEILKASKTKSQDEEQIAAEKAAKAAAEVPAPVQSQPPMKAPSVASKPIESRPVANAPSAPSSSSSSSAPGRYEPASSFIPIMRLLNKDGSDGVTISRMKDINMRTTMMTNDKRIQGMIKNAVNIDGRTKIPDLQRFIQEVLDLKKKIVSTVAFLVFDVNMLDKTNSYVRFCEEFTRDQRASISNVSEAVQLYVIPPELKDSIQILKNVTLDVKDKAPNQGILYGLVVSKEAGPNNMVNRPHSILPFGKSISFLVCVSSCF
jgi:hypothetical protein